MLLKQKLSTQKRLLRHWGWGEKMRFKKLDNKSIRKNFAFDSDLLKIAKNNPVFSVGGAPPKKAMGKSELETKFYACVETGTFN